MKTIAFLCVLFLSLVVRANIYYVAPSGNDTNNGAIVTPFKTITQALNVMQPQDYIYIKAGVYREQPFIWPSASGSTNKHSVLSAYIDPTTKKYDQVFINAATIINGPWIQDGTSNRWYITGFTVQTSGVWIDWSPKNDKTPLKQIGQYGGEQRTITGSTALDMTPGTFFGDMNSQRLYVCLTDRGNPNEHTLEYSSASHCIYQPGSPIAGTNQYSYVSNFDIIGLNLRHTDAYTVFGECSNHAIYTVNNERLIDCNVSFNVACGIQVRQQSQVLNCVVEYNGDNGAEANGTGWLIKGGRFKYNYWRHKQIGSEAGIKVISNSPVIWGDIEGAEVSNNYGKGIWYDTCFQGSTVNHVLNNYIHDNSEDGIDLEASRNFLIANNIIANNGNDGIFINAVENANICNNTVVGNKGTGGGFAAIELNGGTRDQGTVYPGTTGMLNNIVENNIIANNTTAYDIDMPTTHNWAELGNNKSDYNLFYRTPTVQFTDGGTYIGGCQLTAGNLPDWQTAANVDQHSIVALPGFVGGSGIQQYRLSVTSAAIGVGANLTSLFNIDYLGKKRPNSGFDLGAIQH